MGARLLCLDAGRPTARERVHSRTRFLQLQAARLHLLVLLLFCAMCFCVACGACGPASVRYTFHSEQAMCSQYVNGVAVMSNASYQGILGQCVAEHENFARWSCERGADGGQLAMKRTFADDACTTEKPTDWGRVEPTDSCVSHVTFPTYWERVDCPATEQATGCSPPLVSVQIWDDDYCRPEDPRDVGKPNRYSTIRYSPLGVCSASGWGGSNVIYTCTAEGRVLARNHADAQCLQPLNSTRDFDYPAGECNGKGEVWSCHTDEFQFAVGGAAAAHPRQPLALLCSLLAAATLAALTHSR